MPPRIPIVRCLPRGFIVQQNSRPPLSSLVKASTPPPQLTSIRSSSILSSLSDNPSAYHKRIRRGRGPSSGKGKTSGRGHKGQKQHGKVPAGFEGGQTPLHIVKGKRGFTNVHTDELKTVPVSRILSWIAQGRIDPTKPITIRELALSRCVTNIKDGVKLLASSRSHDLSVDEVPPLTQPIHVVVSRASKQAIEAIEEAGGSVMTRYYTRFAVRQIIHGKMDPINSLQSKPLVPPLEGAALEASSQTSLAQQTDATLRLRAAFANRLPDATSRKAIEYYRDPAHRGYLSYQLEEGENPSLFFKRPEDELARRFAAQGRSKKTRKRSTGEKLF